MIQTISRSGFHDQFKALRPNNFTYDGLDALFDYLEQYEADSGEAVELDVIALCCEYSEFQDIAEFQENYDADQYQTLDDIRNSTTVIEWDDDERFIIAIF